MTRGRLIFPFLAELHLRDARMLARDPGLDQDFKEPLLIEAPDDRPPEHVRRELPPVLVPCQVEPKSDDALRMFGAGNAPHVHIELVFHFADLERLGLVDSSTGEPKVCAGDRLGALFTLDGSLVVSVPKEPSLYVVDVSALGFGLPLRAPRRNLLRVVFEDRSGGAPRTGV